MVIDAGIATYSNLGELDKKGYRYVCVSKKRIKDYPVDISEPKTIKLTDRGKNKVELSIFNPSTDGYNDTWMYVESEAKRKKENSMNLKYDKKS